MSSIIFLVIPPIGDTLVVSLVRAQRMANGWLQDAIGHHFDEPFEHVAVLYEGARRDMFVGETSSINGRHIRNVRATEIYRHNALTRAPRLDLESMPPISGPAVLFPDEIVWK